MERLIWAYSPTRPKSSDPSSHIEFHRANGHFTLDLSKELPSDEVSSPTQAKPISSPTQEKPNSSPSPTQGNDKPRPPSGDHDTIIILPFGPYTKREKVLIIHAIFMSFGFLVLLPAGSLIARWGRTFTPIWFKAHQFSNLFLALPVITLGWVLGLMAVIQHEADHFSNAHEVTRLSYLRRRCSILPFLDLRRCARRTLLRAGFFGEVYSQTQGEDCFTQTSPTSEYHPYCSWAGDNSTCIFPGKHSTTHSFC